MSDEVKFVGERNLKLPIRTMKYMIVPACFEGGGGRLVGVTLTSIHVFLHLTAEVNETQFESLVFRCGHNCYVNRLKYKDYSVDYRFINGSNSYFYVKEKHYQRIDSHLFSKDEITDEYENFPYFIEIGRDSHFL